MLRYRQSKANGVFFSVTKEEIFMQLSDKIKKFSVEQAIDYLNRNPVKNLPKLLDWADTFCAGKFEGQRRAISLEGDETTTDSRRSEKEVKRAQRTQKKCVQRTQKNVCKERKSTVSRLGDGAFSSLPLEGTARAHSPAQGKASSALPVLRRVTVKRKNVHGRVLPCTFRVRWGFPGLALRRVSCAGRGPGSGCAAARGRGPGAECRRHSPGRGSAAGCAGRRLRLP